MSEITDERKVEPGSEPWSGPTAQTMLFHLPAFTVAPHNTRGEGMDRKAGLTGVLRPGMAIQTHFQVQARPGGVWRNWGGGNSKLLTCVVCKERKAAWLPLTLDVSSISNVRNYTLTRSAGLTTTPCSREFLTSCHCSVLELLGRVI